MKRGSSASMSSCHAFDLASLVGAQVVVDRAPRLLEVFLHVAPNRGDVSVPGRLGVAPGSFVKTRNVRGKLIDVPRLEEAGLQQLVRPSFDRKAAHTDRPLDDRAFAFDGVNARSIDGDRNDVDIDLGREPAVEAHLRLTGLAPLVEGREIEETEVDGTLDLEYVRCAHEDPGDVCLDQLEAGRFEIRFQLSHHIPAQRRG